MIEIAEYDSRWPGVFIELKTVISRRLGVLAVAVEHVGSTAVPGLAAKPIIDIDIVIESREMLAQTIAALADIGYFHQGDKGIPGREAFGRGNETVPFDGSGRSWPAHHLYVCDKDSSELRRHLTFRDFLRTHPHYVRRYTDLKRGLARRHGDDREAYTNGKADFVAEVMQATDSQR